MGGAIVMGLSRARTGGGGGRFVGKKWIGRSLMAVIACMGMLGASKVSAGGGRECAFRAGVEEARWKGRLEGNVVESRRNILFKSATKDGAGEEEEVKEAGGRWLFFRYTEEERGAMQRSGLRLRGGSEEMVNAADEAEDEGEPLSPLKKTVNAFIERGCMLWDEKKDAAGAEAAFKEALTMDPTDSDAWSSLGVLLQEQPDMSRIAEAIQAFERALEHNALHVEALHHCGNHLFSHQKDAEAERLYKRALDAIESELLVDPSELTEEDVDELHPLYVPTMCNYGAMLERVRGKVDEAEELYRRALRLRPTDSTALFNLAVLMDDRRKDHDQAEMLYRKALETDAEDVNVLVNLGLLYQNVRQSYAEAEECYQKAYEVSPERSDVLLNYALFMEDVRTDFPSAEALYQRALEVDGEDVMALCHYGGLLRRLGKGIDAQALYRQAKEVDEDSANQIIALRSKAHDAGPPHPATATATESLAAGPGPG